MEVNKMSTTTENNEEILNDLPEEWIELLDTMPELKQDWIEYVENNYPDSIPDFFFTLYLDYVEKYADYKPFFTCIERGEEVFDSFYEVYGSWCDKTDEEKAKEREEFANRPKWDETQLILRIHLKHMWNYGTDIWNLIL